MTKIIRNLIIPKKSKKKNLLECGCGFMAAACRGSNGP